MAFHKGGGDNGAPRIRTLSADKLPEPLPGEVPVNSITVARREDGKIATSEAAKELGRRGGEAKANKKRLLQGLGLATLPDNNAFRRYWDAVQAWVEAQLVETARCGGGYLGPGAASMIGSAGVALAASRYFSDLGFMTTEGHYFMTASKLADQSQRHLMGAYELATREGKARAELAQPNVIDVFEAALEEQAKQGPAE
jgi:hypothetical protein